MIVDVITLAIAFLELCILDCFPCTAHDLFLAEVDSNYPQDEQLKYPPRSIFSMAEDASLGSSSFRVHATSGRIAVAMRNKLE